MFAIEVRHQLLEEMSMMKSAGSHPHLVGLLGYCTQPDNPVCLVLEYMKGGDLLRYLHRIRDSLNELSSLLESPGVFSLAESKYLSSIKKRFVF